VKPRKGALRLPKSFRSFHDTIATLQLKQLRQLAAIVEAGSIRAAAHRLDIAQPALSRSIRSAEVGLGVKMLERGPSGVVPTEYGTALLQYVRAIEANLRLAASDLDAIRGIPAATVRMGVGPIEGPPFASVVIARMLERYPHVRFTVREGIFGTLRRALLEGDIDFIVGPSAIDGPGPGLTAEIIAYRRETLVVVRAQHPLARKRSVTLSELADARWVLPASETPTYMSFAETFIHSGLVAPTGPIIAPASSKTAMALILANDLIGLLPTDVLLNELKQGALKRVVFEGPLFTPPVSLITRDPIALPPICFETITELRRIGSKLNA
jgi:DNA-binding transcriptional LysR family regulator